MEVYVHLSHGARRELDYLLKVGPVKYLQRKLNDLGLGSLGTKGAVHHSVDHRETKDDKSDSASYDVSAEAEKFINDHMEELQEITVKAIKQVTPPEYDDQKMYISAVFAYVGEACWTYLQDIYADPEISQELSDKISETMIKDAAVIAASDMFIEWALDQKKHTSETKDKDITEVKENEEVETE